MHGSEVLIRIDCRAVGADRHPASDEEWEGVHGDRDCAVPVAAGGGALAPHRAAHCEHEDERHGDGVRRLPDRRGGRGPGVAAGAGSVSVGSSIGPPSRDWCGDGYTAGGGS